MDTFTFIVAAILVGFFGLNLYSTVLISQYARKAKWSLPALNERAISTGIKTVGTFLLAVLGANRIFDWHLAEPIVLTILSVAVILHSLPPIVWLYFLKTGRFRGDEHLSNINQG